MTEILKIFSTPSLHYYILSTHGLYMVSNNNNLIYIPSDIHNSLDKNPYYCINDGHYHFVIHDEMIFMIHNCHTIHDDNFLCFRRSILIIERTRHLDYMMIIKCTDTLSINYILEEMATNAHIHDDTSNHDIFQDNVRITHFAILNLPIYNIINDRNVVYYVYNKFALYMNRNNFVKIPFDSKINLDHVRNQNFIRTPFNSNIKSHYIRNRKKCKCYFNEPSKIKCKKITLTLLGVYEFEYEDHMDQDSTDEKTCDNIIVDDILNLYVIESKYLMFTPDENAVIIYNNGKKKQRITGNTVTIQLENYFLDYNFLTQLTRRRLFNHNITFINKKKLILPQIMNTLPIIHSCTKIEQFFQIADPLLEFYQPYVTTLIMTTLANELEILIEMLQSDNYVYIDTIMDYFYQIDPTGSFFQNIGKLLYICASYTYTRIKNIHEYFYHQIVKRYIYTTSVQELSPKQKKIYDEIAIGFNIQRKNQPISLPDEYICQLIDNKGSIQLV